MTSEYGSALMARLGAVLRQAAPERMLCRDIAEAAHMDRRTAARWLQEGDGLYWRSEKVRLVTPRYKSPRWHRVYWGGEDA